MKNTTIYVVSHTHWDREWQKTFNEYRVRLIKFIDKLILTLEKDKNFRTFMLDGQTSLLEDYLEIKPTMKTRLAQLIKDNRIIIGPWYVQPDEFIPSGESLLRNLLIGNLMSEEYGQKMKVGYLPDSFGQSIFMPQVLNQFEIKHAVAMRGFDKKEIKANEFIWSDPSGSEVICSVLWSGYNNGSQLVHDFKQAKEAVKANLNELSKSSSQNNILLLSGSDQSTVRNNIPLRIDELNSEYENILFKQATLEEYLNAVEKSKDNFETFSGDFRKAQKQRVHMSIAGTRTDIKQKNYEIETEIEKITEPLSTIGFTFKDRYEQELLLYAWKKILENHAHDSIATVSTDRVHENMISRINAAEDTLGALNKAKINTLIEKIKFSDNPDLRPIVVFNTNSTNIEDYTTCVVDAYSSFELLDNNGKKIEYVILDKKEVDLKDFRLWLKPNPSDIVTRTTIKFRANIEGIGFNTYYIKEVNQREKEVINTAISVSDNSISNDHIKISANSDGSLNFLNKETLVELKNALYLVEEGNGGDSYDFSPPFSNEVHDSRNFDTSIITEMVNKFEAILKIKKVMSVNKYTTQEKRHPEKIELPIEIICRLNARDDYIDFKVNLDNTAINHRVSLIIPNFSKSNHYREGSFGDIPTANTVTEINTVDKGWKEYYYPVYATQRYVYDEDSSIALFNKGVPSYEIENDKDLKVHLLTTTDYMGKKDLKYRPGRRSGANIATPDSLLMGDRSFEFRLSLFENKKLVHKEADKFQNPFFSHYVHKKKLTGYVTDETMTFTISNNSVVTSALVKSVYGEEIIWRIKNMSNQTISNVTLQYNSNLYELMNEVNMLGNQPKLNRIEEEFVSDYVGEEYEGSGELITSGKILLSYLKPNELCSLKFKKRLN